MKPPPAGVEWLDDILPEFEHREVHRRRYRADVPRLRQSLLQLQPADLPLTSALFAVRMLSIRRGRGQDGPSLVARLEAGRFRQVVDEPERLAFVVIGRFWRPDGGRIPVSAIDEFRRFDEPGYAKGVLALEFMPEPGGGTWGVTETRVATTDRRARRLMAAYWRLIRPPSGLIRRELLAALEKATAGKA